MNVFITYNPTSAYIQDSSAPSRHFTFNTLILPDGTTCYWVIHCPWSSQFNTNLPQLDGYASTALNANTNTVNILLNTYYK